MMHAELSDLELLRQYTGLMIFLLDLDDVTQEEENDLQSMKAEILRRMGS